MANVKMSAAAKKMEALIADEQHPLHGHLDDIHNGLIVASRGTWNEAMRAQVFDAGGKVLALLDTNALKATLREKPSAKTRSALVELQRKLIDTAAVAMQEEVKSLVQDLPAPSLSSRFR